MGRRYIDCRTFPNEASYSVTISADSGVELLEAAVQHAAPVHKHTDSPELRVQLQTPFQDGIPVMASPKTATA